MVKYEPEEQTVVNPGDKVRIERGELKCTWASPDNNAMHIIHQMVEIWKHCEFPNGYIYDCRPYISWMEPDLPKYVVCVSTPHCSANAIDWSKAEWVVNVVGKPQLKIKGDSINERTLCGEHIHWAILFYVDVLDVVKPEGKRAESITIDEDAIMPFSVKEEIVKSIDQELKLAIGSSYEITRDDPAFEDFYTYDNIAKEIYNNPGFYFSVLNDTVNPLWPKEIYNIGGNTMNEYEIEKAIRDGGYTEYQRNIIKCFLLRNGLLSNTKLEEVRNIRRDLRPSPKKVIYNGPATIVIFEDGSKTVVKLQEGETMDREKAVYAAICKRMFGSNKNRSNWLDILKPLMKSADEALRVKSEKDALNDDIKKYSCKMEFDDYEDAAGFINLIRVLRYKNLKKEKEVVDILGYPSLTAFRKAVKAAKEMIKDGKES